MKFTDFNVRFWFTSIINGDLLPASVVPEPAHGAVATVVPGLKTPVKLVTSSANKARAQPGVVVFVDAKGTTIVEFESEGFKGEPPELFVYHLIFVPAGLLTWNCVRLAVLSVHPL